LRKRKQPEMIDNRVRGAVNGILGITVQGKSEPRAWPRTPKDEDSADVATDVLRWAADENNFNALKIQCFKDMLVPGTMAVIVEVDEDLKPVTTQIRWEEFFYDPRARRNDFEDARYKGIAKWRYLADVKRDYPEIAGDISAWVSNWNMPWDDTTSDRPVNQMWCDRKNARILVIEMYVREAEWMRCVFYGGGILEREKSPYLDDKKRTTCPIEAQSSYVDRDNNRYGPVVDMIGPQDEINKRRSRALHLINSRQLQAVDPAAVEVDAGQARLEAARADGVIPYGWQVAPTNDMAQGNMELLADARASIERFGPSPAILGRQSADSSGRAVLARQQAGLTELAILFDGLNDWELRVYRQIWSRVQQFWQAEQYIRVTDDEDAPKFVGINTPIQGPPQVMLDQVTGQVSVGRPILGYKNPVGEMDVDIKLDTQPDVANIQQEQFRDLIQVVGSNPMYAQQIPFEVMLELSTVPHKRQIIDKIKKYREEQAQAGAQQQQMQQKIAIETAMAEIEKTRSESQLNEAKANSEGVNAAVKVQTVSEPQPAAMDKGE